MKVPTSPGSEILASANRRKRDASRGKLDIATSGSPSSEEGTDGKEARRGRSWYRQTGAQGRSPEKIPGSRTVLENSSRRADRVAELERERALYKHTQLSYTAPAETQGKMDIRTSSSRVRPKGLYTRRDSSHHSWTSIPDTTEPRTHHLDTRKLRELLDLDLKRQEALDQQRRLTNEALSRTHRTRYDTNSTRNVTASGGRIKIPISSRHNISVGLEETNETEGRELERKEGGRERDREREAARRSATMASPSALGITRSTSRPTEVKAKSSGSTVHVDVELRKEPKVRTENALLDLLEGERSRYIQLEADYHKLLNEVQALQRSHQQELSDYQRKEENRIRTLEKAAAIKTDENTTLQQELVKWQNKFSKESMVWKSAKDRFDANTEALERALQESGLRESNQRKEMEDVLRIKSDITRRLQMREAEVKRLEEEHRVKDAAADEQRVMLSEKINLLEQSMNRRDDDVQKLKSAMHRQQRDDQKEIRALREALEESQRDLSEMISRNKQSSADLEESVSTCAKLSHQIGELSNTHREDQADIRELSQKCATQLEELERLLASETYLKRELAASEHRLSQMAEEKVRAETQLVSSQRTANALQLDLDKWRLKAEDLKGAHDQLKIAHERLVQSEGSLKSERNDLLSIRDRQTRDIEAAASERKHLIDKISELQRAVDKEASLHADVKAQSKERLMDLAEKFRSLQKNLDEAQVEVDKFRGAERILRTALRDKEDSAHKYALRVKELETTVRNQQHQLALDHQKVDDIKIRKKEELLAVNDKFSAAKSAMDAQAADLRTRLQAKSAKIADLDNHLSRAKIELSEATAERLRLEARIYELTVTSESRQHELVSLQSSLAEKEREIASLHSQMASVRESAEQSQKQLKALKGAEIEKVTGKVSELNKKLAAKVDELLQSGARRDHRVSDRSDSPTPTTSPQQRMYKKHSEAPDIKSLLFDSHTKRTHVDEPPKITTTSRRWFDEPTRLRSSSRSRSSSPSRAQQHRRSGDDIRSDSVTRLEGDVEKMNQRLQDQVKALLAKKSAAGSSAPRSEQPARNQSHYGGDASTRAGKGKSTTFYDDETSQSHENVLSSSTNASSAAAAFPTIHISAPTGPLFAGARHAGGSSHRVNDTTSTSTSASLPAHRHQQQRRPVDGSGDSLAVFQSALDIQAGDDGNNDSDGNVFDRMGSLKDLGSTYHFGEDDGDFGNTHPLSARKDEQEGLFATSPLVRPSADDGMAW